MGVGRRAKEIAATLQVVQPVELTARVAHVELVEGVTAVMLLPLPVLCGPRPRSARDAADEHVDAHDHDDDDHQQEEVVDPTGSAVVEGEGAEAGRVVIERHGQVIVAR